MILSLMKAKMIGRFCSYNFDNDFAPKFDFCLRIVYTKKVKTGVSFGKSSQARRFSADKPVFVYLRR